MKTFKKIMIQLGGVALFVLFAIIAGCQGNPIDEVIARSAQTSDVPPLKSIETERISDEERSDEYERAGQRDYVASAAGSDKQDTDAGKEDGGSGEGIGETTDAHYDSGDGDKCAEGILMSADYTAENSSQEEPVDRGSYSDSGDHCSPDPDFEVIWDPYTPDSEGWCYVHGGNQINSTYMGVHCITDTTSAQWAWLHSHDWDFDEEGIVTYDGRILVALTPTYGEIGDYVDLQLEDGSILPVIIGDVKWNAGIYGHQIGDYFNVIELIVAPWWYECDHENIYYPNVNAWRTLG
mgnify:CR=1 FL=1